MYVRVKCLRNVRVNTRVDLLHRCAITVGRIGDAAATRRWYRFSAFEVMKETSRLKYTSSYQRSKVK